MSIKRSPFRLLLNTSGLTLLELTTVMIILGILANFVFVAWGDLLCKARDARRKADLQMLRVAVEMYYSDKGTYLMPGTGAAGLGAGGNVNQGNGASVGGLVPYP